MSRESVLDFQMGRATREIHQSFRAIPFNIIYESVLSHICVLQYLLRAKDRHLICHFLQRLVILNCSDQRSLIAYILIDTLRLM